MASLGEQQFNEAADFSSSVLFTYYGLVDPKDPIGKVYLPVETFVRLNSFIESLEKRCVFMVS